MKLLFAMQHCINALLKILAAIRQDLTILQVAARAGGIFFPLAKALCLSCGSDPAKGTEKKVGSYLMLTCFQTTTISSAMFITAMAANPLAVNLAADALGSTISWGTWALAGETRPVTQFCVNFRLESSSWHALLLDVIANKLLHNPLHSQVSKLCSYIAGSNLPEQSGVCGCAESALQMSISYQILQQGR